MLVVLSGKSEWMGGFQVDVCRIGSTSVLLLSSRLGYGNVLLR